MLVSFVFAYAQPITMCYRQKRVCRAWKVLCLATKEIWINHLWQHTANHHLHGSRKRNGEQRRTMVSFGRTMMWALELLRLAKTCLRMKQWGSVKKSGLYTYPFLSYASLKASVSQIVSQHKIVLNKNFKNSLATWWKSLELI